MLITFVAFIVVAAIMAVGLIFQGKCLRGSCGGEEIVGPNGELLNCDTCPVHERRNAEDPVGTSSS